VSPNYASEIGSGPDKGVELDSVIRMVSQHGIMQGWGGLICRGSSCCNIVVGECGFAHQQLLV
jgi:hypothetical protein